jgi:Adenylate and Guanylate cyclase catalytic domain
VAASSVRRRLATVLFIDIVGSTALAAKLGDERWRELLTRFRRIVRADLKRHGGREQDTAGDGFFATFDQPARALRASAAIVADVQELGVDVRCGVHTGECEEIDGRLGGIAVHVGARVMSLAGAGEVFVTSTVAELVAGSGAEFEDRGSHELKGVEGERHLLALTAYGTPLPQPLPAEVAAQRLALVIPSKRSRRVRVALLAAAVVVAAAIVVPVLALTGGGARAAEPVSLLRLDARTRHVDSIVRGRPLGLDQWANLWSVDGTLWQFVGQRSPQLVTRSLRTGAVKQTIALPRDFCSCHVAFGFGSVWLLDSKFVTSGPNAGTVEAVVNRMDELSGRSLRKIVFLGDVDSGTIATGNGAVWVLESDGRLVRIDPLTNRVARTFETHASETRTLIPLAGSEWICECLFNKVMRFDGRTGRSRTFNIAEQAYLVGVEGTQGETLWLLDPQGATLTPMDPVTGATEPPLGLSGQPRQAVIAFGAVWAAAGHVVDRLDLQTRARTAIPMPAGVWAGSIAADPRTNSLWVGNSGSAPPQA